MQQKKEEKVCENQAENTTTAYLKSISKRYQYKNILAQFIDIETGACLECGHVHSFHNIDEAIKRRDKLQSAYLDRLFWEAAI